MIQQNSDRTPVTLDPVMKHVAQAPEPPVVAASAVTSQVRFEDSEQTEKQTTPVKKAENMISGSSTNSLAK